MKSGMLWYKKWLFAEFHSTHEDCDWIKEQDNAREDLE